MRPKPSRAFQPIIRIATPGNYEANCTRCECPKGMQPIVEFAPAICNRMHRKRAAFLKIAAAINSLFDDPDCEELLKQLGALRNKTCRTCMLIAKKTKQNPDTKAGKCRIKWYELKAQLNEVGCSLCGCNDAMTVEHTVPREKMRDNKDRPVELSDYSKWTTLGGPEAMQAEYDKPSVVPMCLNCQLMQPTHAAMKEKTDLDHLPDVRFITDAKVYVKKNTLNMRRKKRLYVNERKLAIGKCDECTYRVVPHGDEWTPGVTGWPHAFQWAHRSELDKDSCVSKIVNSNASFKASKLKLDTEIGRCRLLCQCCGKTETDDRMNAPGPSEEGN